MKDIKELIYKAVEEDAVAFQELAGNILQARAYDAIEAMRPEVGASMFGEAKEMKDDEEEMEDEENEEMEDEDEEEMDDKKKSMKEALHPNQQKIDVVDDEKIDAKDFAKLRKMKEEVEQIDEVDHPKNQADMLAHIIHQVKVSGHPVATDAQFRATTVGKDTSKRASLEPGDDKAHYAVAQGGNVKEESEIDEASYSAKAARAGKDIGKPGKMFDVIAQKAGEKYGSAERGKKVAGAVLAKLRAKGK